MSQAVQMIFSFDTTGSMQPCLAALRDQIDALACELLRDVPGLEIGLIAHGDYCDGANLIKTLAFTTDPASVAKWVHTVPNTSGGDAPEAYEIALRSAAQEFKWRSSARKILVVCGDSVPHEPNYPQNVERVDWKEELKRLQALGVQCFGVQCLNSASSTWFYNDIANSTGGLVLPMQDMNSIVALFRLVGTAGLSEEPLAVLVVPALGTPAKAQRHVSINVEDPHGLAVLHRVGAIGDATSTDAVGKWLLACVSAGSVCAGADAWLVQIEQIQGNAAPYVVSLSTHYDYPSVRVVSVLPTAPHMEAVALVPTIGGFTVEPGPDGPLRLTLYHGTSLANATAIRVHGFMPSVDGCLGGGIYFADNVKAARFAHDRHTAAPAMLKCTVRVHSPKYVRGNCKTWRVEGFDGCRAATTSMSPNAEWCVWSGDQVTVEEVVDLAGKARP